MTTAGSNPPSQTTAPPAPWWAGQRFGLVLSWVVTGLLVGVHLVFAFQAGALWRDEAGTASFAAMPSWAEIWQHLQYDNFPPFLLVVLRAWNGLGFADSDSGYRVFGCLVGLGIIGTLWWNGRLLGYRIPLWSLILFALNPLTVSAGDALRPHGLGLLLLLVAVGVIWKALFAPRAVWMLPGAVVAVLSVQTLYQNAFFLGAVCAGAAAVAWRRKACGMGLRAGGIGLVAALSLLPHLANLRRAQSWAMVMKAPASPGLILGNMAEAFAAAGFWNVAVWGTLLGLAMVRAWHLNFGELRRRVDRQQKDVSLFIAVVLLTGTVAFAVFLLAQQLYPRPWYFLSLMALAGLAIDAIRVGPNSARATPGVLNGLTALLAVLSVPAVWQAAHVRQTNLDGIAAHLNAEAKPGDLILVHPWYCGISFQRYYRGSAPWTTLPPLADHRIHRYDLFKAQMQQPNPLQPVLQQIRLALQSGHRVWLVGDLPTPDTPPPEPRPAPNNPWGWSDEPYSYLWGARVGYLLKQHAEAGTYLIAPKTRGVNPFENLPLIQFTGWKIGATPFPGPP